MSVKRVRLKLKHPSPNGSDTKAPIAGKDPATGRFVKGWKGGPGNPHASETAKLRAALLREVKEGDVQAIIRKMIAKAKQGNVEAARLVLDRLFGKPPQNVTLDIDPSMEGFDRDERFL